MGNPLNLDVEQSRQVNGATVVAVSESGLLRCDASFPYGDTVIGCLWGR